MAYTKFSGTYRSSNHKNRIHYYIFEPEADIRAILQITHGWKDYIERSENLIRFFTDHGIMVCGCDFIGHGRSSREEERGHFEEQDGWIYLVRDVKKLTSYVKREYPGIPCFLYGHGMGSLVARLCCIHNPALDGVILSGTSGKQRFCRRAILLTSILRRLPHQERWSLLVEKLIYIKLNFKFHHENDDLSWFSGEHKIREKYAADERTRFHFTLNAYENIFKMLALTSTKKWYHSVEIDLPVLLLGGREDPIGNFGKGIKEVENNLSKEGSLVQTRLYDNIRHELQSDPKHEKIFGDILGWMEAYVVEPSGLTIIY